MTDRAKQVTLGLLFWFVFSIPVLLAIMLLPVAIFAYACGAENMRPWVYRVGKALDQTVNAALFGGHSKETVSSHAGRWRVSLQPMPFKFRAVEWITDLFEKDHCIKAVEDAFMNEPL